LARESQATVSAPAASPRTAAAAVGRYRWRICALLFFATTINYVDRQVLGVLAPHLQQVIGWNEIQYGYIVAAFQGAYAIGLLAMGGVIDRLGTRLGYALAILIWSLAAIGHSLVRSVAGFAAARFLLGLGEAGNFPAAVKTVAEWFPQKERSFATGVFNSGTNAGAILAPLLAPWIALRFGWQWAFVFTGFFSAIWLVAWLVIYRQPSRHPRLSPAELRYIQSGPQGGVEGGLQPAPGFSLTPASRTEVPRGLKSALQKRPRVSEDAGERISWIRLASHRQAWAFLTGKLVTDPIWWFFLFWLPKFLNARHGLTLTNLGLPLIAIYLSADAGSIAGGWLASWLLKRGWSVNRARKTAMLCCALAVLPVTFAAKIDSLWGAVAVISLAAAAHQGWSVNLLTLTSDLFPRRAVASVTGFGGFGGAVSGMVISNVVGFLLQFTGSYVPVFLMAGFAYLVALAAIHLLVPRLEPAGL
jgi:MFS transporter, ACS family, hexuronate transporter